MNSHKSTLRAVRFLPALLALASLTPVYSSTPRETALADSPLAYYELGVAKGSTPVLDAISGAAVGTHAGTLPAAVGAIIASADQATNYDGVSALTTLPYTAAWNPASFTFEAWVQPNVEGSDTPQVIVGNGTQQGWKITQGKSLSADSGTKGYTVAFYAGSATPSIQLTGGSYSVGFWSHIVVTYDAATKTAKLYVDKILSPGATQANISYTPNSSQAMTLGGDTGATKLFNGFLDEVALYPRVLGQTEISAHYDNANDSAPSQSYDSLVKGTPSTQPAYYLRLDEADSNRVVAVNAAGDPAVNHRSLGTAGNALQFPGAGLQVPGALAGSTDTAVHYDAIDKVGFNGAYSTVLPYDEKLNTQSFSAEAWIRPLSASSDNNANVFRNHNDGSVRSGWVVWQNKDTGYSFRLYNHDLDVNGKPVKAINLSAGTYTQGQWQHLVVTFDYPTRTATMYLNGNPVGTPQTIAASASNYAPLTREEGFIPSFGGFSDGYQNPFIGDMDEVAYYDRALTAGQVSAHYLNGTSSTRTTPYEVLIASDEPVAYYRQDEAAKVQIPNLVPAHPELAGTAVNAPSSVAGPGAPADPGFPANTKASDFNGDKKTYIELNNPATLNIAGVMTLEAWIQPDADQPASAYIIGHGSDNNFVREVFLRIEGGNYQVGDTGATPASFPVPAGDLGGGGWVHLVGTWSNGTWTLYRNGASVATAADATGPQQIADANWAIGARGRWATPGFPDAPSGDQRVFNGTIATAAIYDTALDLGKVQTHYNSGTTLSSALSPLVIVQVGNTVKLTWTSGTLAQSSDLVNWTDVTGAVSPYTTTVSSKQFFRLHN